MRNRDHLLTQLALGIILALHLYITWFMPYTISQDGPSHMANARNIISLIKGDCPEITSLYHFTQAPVPNWIIHGFAVILLQLFSIPVAEKIIITAIVLSFAYGLFVLVRSSENKPYYIIIPLMLLLANIIFYGGGYNYMISFSLYFAAVAWWITKGHVHSKKNFLYTVAMFIALYFFHFIALAAFVLTIAALELHRIVARKNLSDSFKRAAFYLVAALPVIIMFAMYYLLPKMPIEGSFNMAQRITSLIIPISLNTLKGDDHYWFIIIIAMLLWLFVLLTALKKFISKDKGNNRFLYVAAIFMLAILFTPATFAGGWIVMQRVQIFFFAFLLLWAAEQKKGKYEKALIVIIALGLNLYTLYDKYYIYVSYEKLMASFLEITEEIPPHSIIYSLNISPFMIDYENGVQNLGFPFNNATGYLTAGTKCVAEVGNYHSSEKNVFPVSYRDETNPHYVLGQFRTEEAIGLLPPKIDFDKFHNSTGLNIDYVVLFGNKSGLYKYKPEEKFNEVELYDQFMAEVNSHYTLHHSSKDGLLNIYKLKSSAQ